MFAGIHYWGPHLNWAVEGREGFLRSVNLGHATSAAEIVLVTLKNSVLTAGLQSYDMSFSLSLATNESGSPHMGLRETLTAGETQPRDGEEQK